MQTGNPQHLVEPLGLWTQSGAAACGGFLLQRDSVSCWSLFVSIWALNVIVVPQGFLQQLRQIAARMAAGSRGAGLGVKLLMGAGALAYGVKEATYTGSSARCVNMFTRHSTWQGPAGCQGSPLIGIPLYTQSKCT